jgi:hypothetical protein
MLRPRHADSRSLVRRLKPAPSATRGALALALAIAVLATGGHLPHIHEEHAGAGVYNEAHVLEGAAALAADAPVPSAPAAQAIATVVSAPAAMARPLARAPALRRAEPRAPPST